MQKPNKIIRILKDNSGASILFVMGVALLLLAISTSALVAASASMGAGIAKQNRNQLNLYADGIQKAIMSSLMLDEDEGKDIFASAPDALTTLNGQILREIYESFEPLIPETATSFASELSIPFNGLEFGGDDSFECTVDILTEPYAIFNTPTSIMVSSKVEVRAVVTYRGVTLTSVVTYNYSGGLLENDGSGVVTIENAGDWRFVSHEKVDNQD